VQSKYLSGDFLENLAIYVGLKDSGFSLYKAG